MIPAGHITRWAKNAPWPTREQVEQDLVLSRLIVEIANHPLLGDELVTAEPGSAGKRAGPVKGFIANTERAAGGLPLRRMPNWLRPVVNWLMPRIGPRGAEFARARVEMKAIETVLHLRRSAPARAAPPRPGRLCAAPPPRQYGRWSPANQPSWKNLRSASDHPPAWPARNPAP